MITKRETCDFTYNGINGVGEEPANLSVQTPGKDETGKAAL